MTRYMPEGFLLLKDENEENTFTQASIKKAFLNSEYLEARPYMCDSGHNLHFRLGPVNGFMPYEECAEGIREGTTKDIAILSRVNKPTGFYIEEIIEDSGGMRAVLSRVRRQRECRECYISSLRVGDVIDAAVTHIEPFGAFCDIGSGITALLPIDNISVSRIPTPHARFGQGDRIKAVVKDIDENGRITLTHKELLGTWKENASNFSVGETVTGIIRSVESYGIFVELTPNLAGLAEYVPLAAEGQTASVFIKSINPEKMKVKLIIIETQSIPQKRPPLYYFIKDGHIDLWRYSPEESGRIIQTDFT